MPLNKKESNRLIQEKALLEKWIVNHDRISIQETGGNPPTFYRIVFQNIKTTVVQNKEDLKLTEPPVKIMPVTIVMTMNLENYPLSKPEIIMSPAFDQKGSILYLYNTHVLFFSVCLFTRWHIQFTLVDVIRRAWNLITYNHHIMGLDRKDCLNPYALEYYKTMMLKQKLYFPLDTAIEYEDLSMLHQQKKNPGALFKFSNLKNGTIK
ncbi:hypothetical protein JW835_06895 [bacterium]|nr:hypothetical protein [bacterium]